MMVNGKRVARRIGVRAEYWQVESGEYYVLNEQRGFVLVDHSPALYLAIFEAWQAEVAHGQSHSVPESPRSNGDGGQGAAAVH